MIQQGHPYRHKSRKVIALRVLSESQVYVLVVADNPMAWDTYVTNTANLRPLPLRYLHGEMA